MERKDIKKVLRNASNELVNQALSYVNLTDKELQIIEYCERKGKTEEETAEILDLSVRGLQDIKKNAYEKLNIVWSYNLFVSMMLKSEV